MSDLRPRIARNGLSITELSRRTGKSPRTIATWTSEPREVYLARAAERRQKIIELRAKGLSMRAIANELDIAVGTVHHALNYNSK